MVVNDFASKLECAATWANLSFVRDIELLVELPST
jgi:hypothetical protein